MTAGATDKGAAGEGAASEGAASERAASERAASERESAESNGDPGEGARVDGTADRDNGPGTGGSGSSADHGVPAERTRLAWRRTGLAATAVGLLAARPALRPDAGGVRWLVAALAMVGWAAMIILAYRRGRALALRPPPPGRLTIVAYALTTVVFTVLGGLVVML